jgi:hypothetical protein
MTYGETRRAETGFGSAETRHLPHDPFNEHLIARV